MVAVFILIQTLSCQILVTDQFPEHQPQPVINAMLVAGDTATINITYSKKVDSTDFIYCNNATVILYRNDKLFDTLTYIDEGNYESDQIIIEKSNYLCVIDIPNYPKITANTFVPSKAKISNIKHIYNVGVTEEGVWYPAIDISFSNDTNASNYYEIILHTYKEYRDDGYWTMPNLIFFNDSIILNEGLPLALFSNKLISDTVHTIHLNYDTGSHSKYNNEPWVSELFPLQVELKSVSYEYYCFKQSFYLYENGIYGDGIIAPMGNSNLYSNIENGIGIFCGYSNDYSEIFTPNDQNQYD